MFHLTDFQWLKKPLFNEKLREVEAAGLTQYIYSLLVVKKLTNTAL